jgi:hypothetical protein
MTLRPTASLSALELDARLVPLYCLMAETADREARIATAPSSGSRLAGLGLYPIATLEKQRLNVIGNLVKSG